MIPRKTAFTSGPITTDRDGQGSTVPGVPGYSMFLSPISVQRSPNAFPWVILLEKKKPVLILLSEYFPIPLPGMYFLIWKFHLNIPWILMYWTLWVKKFITELLINTMNRECNWTLHLIKVGFTLLKCKAAIIQWLKRSSNLRGYLITWSGILKGSDLITLTSFILPDPFRIIFRRNGFWMSYIRVFWIFKKIYFLFIRFINFKIFIIAPWIKGG